MGQGGATDVDHLEELIEPIANYVIGEPDLASELKTLLEGKADKKFEELTVDEVVTLLQNNGDVLQAVAEYFTKNQKGLKILLEQASKVKGMEEKLEALGDQLLMQGVIGGAAVTTLTGALAGSLAVGGVAGALLGGGLALVGFLAIVAIAAIAYAVYQYRGEIKEGAIEIGKAVKGFVKNVIDKLPEFKQRENNFSRLDKFLSQSIESCIESEILSADYKAKENKESLDMKKVIKMFRSKEQLAAIRKLIGEEEIQGFSQEDVDRLVKKGLSTFEKDMKGSGDKKGLEDLMEEFLPKIMVTVHRLWE